MNINFILPDNDWSRLWILQFIFFWRYSQLLIRMNLQYGCVAPKHSRVNWNHILIGGDGPMEDVLFVNNLAKCSTDGESISSVPATHPLFAIVSWLLLSFVFVSENSSGLYQVLEFFYASGKSKFLLCFNTFSLRFLNSI